MMREKGTEFGAVIGYSSDKMGPLGITRCVPQEIMFFFPYGKSISNQAN